jgi:thiol-disulfide isomerase/thioredoxin
MRAFLAAIFVAASSLSFSQSKLTIGDQAPELKVANWVKGKPVKIGTGKYTVVEFWATWCGPCKTSIPHLTEMAKKYKGKVDFVGISVWESSPKDYTTKVPAFVKEMGGKMDYNVATDSADLHMAQKWMQAAGENGIPAAFLVDPKGKVTWIGHPMDGLDKVIDKALSGKFSIADAMKERKQKEAEQEAAMKAQAKMEAEMKDLISAAQAKDWKKVIEESDKLEKKGPQFAEIAQSTRYQAMLESNHPDLPKQIEKMGSTVTTKEGVDYLNSILWSGVELDRKLRPESLNAFVKLGEKMMALNPKDPMAMDTFALAQWRAGLKEEALKNQKKAIELAKTDSRVDASTMKDMQSRLKMYGG